MADHQQPKRAKICDVQPTQAMLLGGSTPAGAFTADAERERELKRMRNRESARRSRQRKADEVVHMKHKVEALRTEHKRLTGLLVACKQQQLQHGTAGASAMSDAAPWMASRPQMLLDTLSSVAVPRVPSVQLAQPAALQNQGSSTRTLLDFQQQQQQQATDFVVHVGNPCGNALQQPQQELPAPALGWHGGSLKQALSAQAPSRSTLIISDDDSADDESVVVTLGVRSSQPLVTTLLPGAPAGSARKQQQAQVLFGRGAALLQTTASAGSPNCSTDSTCTAFRPAPLDHSRSLCADGSSIAWSQAATAAAAAALAAARPGPAVRLPPPALQGLLWRGDSASAGKPAQPLQLPGSGDQVEWMEQVHEQRRLPAGLPPPALLQFQSTIGPVPRPVPSPDVAAEGLVLPSCPAVALRVLRLGTHSTTPQHTSAAISSALVPAASQAPLCCLPAAAVPITSQPPAMGRQQLVDAFAGALECLDAVMAENGDFLLEEDALMQACDDALTGKCCSML